jgi:hypothetical protein
MRGDFTRSILKSYKACQILTEGDLQSFAWYRIRQFLKKAKGTTEFRVLNKPFLRESHTYPDLVVFRNGKPWAAIELKESKRLPEKTAEKEREKLKLARKAYSSLKRGYLVYVARYGDKRTLHGSKGENAYYFSEVPIVMWKSKAGADREWTRTFKGWSKYAPEPKV